MAQVSNVIKNELFANKKELYFLFTHFVNTSLITIPAHCCENFMALLMASLTYRVKAKKKIPYTLQQKSCTTKIFFIVDGGLRYENVRQES